MKKMSYSFDFPEIIKYEDIFFQTDNCDYDIYGIGSYDIYADRLIETELDADNGRPPYSASQKYYEQRSVEMYPEFLIERRNEILRECSFKLLEFKKSFALSFLFNYLSNITTAKINENYFDLESSDSRFSKDILEDFLIKKTVW